MAVEFLRMPFWQPRMGALGGVAVGLEDLEQAIQIVVKTQTGSVPLEPEFGCGLLEYLDRPLRQAAAPIMRAVARALRRWEPRVEIGQIWCLQASSYKGEGPSPSLLLRIDWRPIGAEAYVNSEVPLWR